MARALSGLYTGSGPRSGLPPHRRWTQHRRGVCRCCRPYPMRVAMRARSDRSAVRMQTFPYISDELRKEMLAPQHSRLRKIVDTHAASERLYRGSCMLASESPGTVPASANGRGYAFPRQATAGVLPARVVVASQPPRVCRLGQAGGQTWIWLGEGR